MQEIQSMAQAIVDPEQLRQFAAMLKRYSQQVRESTAALTQAQARLADSWRDQEHRRFVDEFEEQVKLVAKLLEATDKHVPYLLKKAEIIEQYLQR
jgi:uncharacterized protein YukE